MTILGSDLREPRPIPRRFSADCFLYRGINEHPLNLRLLSEKTQQPQVGGRPSRRINVETVGAHDHCRLHFLALPKRQSPVWHRAQPDVGVQADLMRRMTVDHWSAARLRHVANEQAGPNSRGAGLVRGSFEKREKKWKTPVSIARRPHHLPRGAVHRQRSRSFHAAAGVEADRLGSARRRRQAPREQLFGGQPGSVRVSQRR